jgi:hypothetical protein
MSDYFKEPGVRENRWDDIITELAVPLILMQDESESIPAGTGFFVSPWLAVTASHVLKACMSHYREHVKFDGEIPAPFQILSFQVLDSGVRILPLRTIRAWFSPPCDIAFLHLVPDGAYSPDRQWKLPKLDLLPPNVGDRIVAFGYPNSRIESSEYGEPGHLHQLPSTSIGEVREVYYERRDEVRMPFPGFRTNAPFDDNMSGGPVFNAAGAICGVIHSSFGQPLEGEEHISFVSTLWLSVGTLIDLEWKDRYPAGTRYPVLELMQAGLIPAANVDRVRIMLGPNGERTVEALDERGAIAGSESAG